MLFQRAVESVELAFSTIAAELYKLEECRAHGASSGRGWKSPIKRALVRCLPKAILNRLQPRPEQLREASVVSVAVEVVPTNFFLFDY